MRSALRMVESRCAITKGGTAFDHVVQGLLELVLGRHVHARGRVVEDEDRWVKKDRSGDGEPLTLASREGYASLSDPGGVAVGQGFDEVMQLGDLRRFDDSIHIHVVDAVGYVVPNAGGEDECVLHDNSDVSP